MTYTHTMRDQSKYMYPTEGTQTPTPMPVGQKLFDIWQQDIGLFKSLLTEELDLEQVQDIRHCIEK